MNTDKHGYKSKNKKAKGKIADLSYSASLRLCGLIFLLSIITAAQTTDFTRWVNPFIGTGGHGHTFPGATVPFGMVQLSPDTRTDNWDGSSGYHYSDDIIYGFSHTHLSGTGIPDGCDILFMPMVGEPQFFAKEGDKSVNGYASKFSHANEKAEPGYYSVKLDDDGILAELTSTKRVGFHRYTFPPNSNAKITLDLTWRDKTLMSQIDVKGDRIEGWRRSSSWAKDQTIYFVAQFSERFAAPYWYEEYTYPEPHITKDQAWIDRSLGRNIRVAFPFSKPKNRQILLKVAISSVSIEGARKNLEAELPGWDFNKVRADAKAAWNKELSKIEVSGGTPDQMTTFYTALYHTMIQPNVFNDVDGQYRGHDGKIHNIYSDRTTTPSVPIKGIGTATPPKHGRESLQKPARQQGRNAKRSDIALPNGRASAPSDQYTVFSLWDTFRAAHPLYTIIDQKRTTDFINTFIRQYEQGGRLPVWELWGNETDTMIGYHAVSVIADAMAKGIKGFDYEKAYEAAKHSAELDHYGLAAYKKRGYISSEDENESVSKTLEYAYDDWCIAQMGQILCEKGLAECQKVPTALESLTFTFHPDYQKFMLRSFNYQNLFDKQAGFVRPRRNGGWISPFQPNEVTFNFTEANSWQYSFFAPQDILGLIELYGDRWKLAKKLDELFTTRQTLSGREQPDITGLIGQYAHGNEPSHHIAYLYNAADEPSKTQKYVRKIMDEFYKNSPDGLIGNEDCGQMSAWYVLSALGFYPVTPGKAEYQIGTPLFKEAKINLENGKSFLILARNVSEKNVYVKSVTINGRRALSWKLTLTHSDIMGGGVMEFDMSEVPTKANRPYGLIDWKPADVRYIPASPIVNATSNIFSVNTTVTMFTLTPSASIYYTLDGSDPSANFNKYTTPISIDRSTVVKAISVSPRGNKSPITEAMFTKRSNDWTVKIASPYSTQYTGGGDDGLIDGIRGTVNFASGEWQGYQGKTFEAVIDLQRETQVSQVGGGFLQVARAWIWMPTHIEFETSTDGVNFTKVADVKTDIATTDMEPTIRDYTQAISPVRARYVRVRAYNFGKIPAWHPGAGGDPWIFVDEILIR